MADEGSLVAPWTGMSTARDVGICASCEGCIIVPGTFVCDVVLECPLAFTRTVE